MIKTQYELKLKNNYYHARAQYRALQRSLGNDLTKRELYTDAIKKMINNKDITEVLESIEKSKDMSRDHSKNAFRTILNIGN